MFLQIVNIVAIVSETSGATKTHRSHEYLKGDCDMGISTTGATGAATGLAGLVGTGGGMASLAGTTAQEEQFQAAASQAAQNALQQGLLANVLSDIQQVEGKIVDNAKVQI
jgi:hypothetical protein